VGHDANARGTSEPVYATASLAALLGCRADERLAALSWCSSSEAPTRPAMSPPAGLDPLRERYTNRHGWLEDVSMLDHAGAGL
jgi:hypothetical protein